MRIIRSCNKNKMTRSRIRNSLSNKSSRSNNKSKRRNNSRKNKNNKKRSRIKTKNSRSKARNKFSNKSNKKNKYIMDMIITMEDNLRKLIKPNR